MLYTERESAVEVPENILFFRGEVSGNSKGRRFVVTKAKYFERKVIKEEN